MINYFETYTDFECIIEETMQAVNALDAVTHSNIRSDHKRHITDLLLTEIRQSMNRANKVNSTLYDAGTRQEKEEEVYMIYR